MPKVEFYLDNEEYMALTKLAEMTTRHVKGMAAFLILNELRKHGLLEPLPPKVEQLEEQIKNYAR